LGFSQTITIHSPGSAPDVYQYIDILIKKVNLKNALNDLTHLLRRTVELLVRSPRYNGIHGGDISLLVGVSNSDLDRQAASVHPGEYREPTSDPK
jgi:hypothetical protein